MRKTTMLLLACLLAVPAAAEEVTLLDGFHFRWEKHPHRINKIGARLSATHARLTMEGGTWATGEAGTDTTTQAAWFTRLESAGLRVHHGTSPELHLKGKIRVGDVRAAVASRTVHLDLDALGLSGHRRFAVLLRGFVLDTDPSHTMGYTTKGIGARIKDVAVLKGLHTGKRTLRFVVWLRIEAGKVPERIQKLRSYEAVGRLQYSVVALEAGRVTRKAHGYTLRYPAGIEPKRPPADAATQTVTILGKPGLPVAAVGLTGFDITLNPKLRFYSGRYMRELRVRNKAFRYSAASGKMTFRCDGYFSNAGPISWALTHRFKAHLVLLQLPGTGSVTHHGVKGPQTGPHTLHPLTHE